MAEFKLGRIRFIWKSVWYTAIEYFIDDVIRYGGRTYVCVEGHTSGTFQTDLDAGYWNLWSDGQEWKDSWSVTTTYKVNDIVKYGGYLYIANEGHTSAATTSLGLENDLAKWDLFSEGFDYKGDWSISTRYKVNDLVRYGAYIYTCITYHTSAATTALGLEADSAKWEIFSKGFNWLNIWTVSTRYKVGDVVRYGGQLYVCNTGHTSNASATLAAGGLEADQAKWDYLHKGIEYKGAWTATNRYKINDVVKWGPSLWICTTLHVSTTTLTADQANWAVFVPGLEFEDSWNSATNYQIGDFVTYGGYGYVAATNNINKAPVSYPADWKLFVTGFNLRGDYNNATAYKIGDVVRLGGFTYIAITDTTGNRPPNVTYWDKLNEGIYWKGNWANATLYDKGDVVRGTTITTNTYICILGHTSNNVGPATITQPDYPPGVGVDTGTYWQLLSGGAESLALTTQGDLLIYGPSGPVRLPIGLPGQTLLVNAAGTLPEWGYFGKINNVWYVAPSGTDLPAPDYGSTLTQPWKTIQYAARQVEYGPLYPSARNLLLRNKAFIQRETIQYINDTFQANCTNTTAPDLITCDSTANLRVGMTVEFTGTTFGGITTSTTYFIIASGFSATQFKVSLTAGGTAEALSTAAGTMVVKLLYDQVKCQRDLGQIIDAVLWDLGHGGNERSRLAAISYYTGSGTYIPGTESETSAAIEFAKTVIDSAISNDNTYTALQGTVPQVFDGAIYEEPQAQGIIEDLMDIIIDAIDAGDIDDVPSEIIANNCIFVKTGIYFEFCPIRVRESTAIVGDELRSTNIRPRGPVTTAADTPYSLAGIDRLRNIIDDIIRNIAITPTAAGYITGFTTPATDVNRTAGTYTDVATSTSGAGSSATFTAIVAAGGVITSLVVGSNAGSNYAVGNTVTIGAGLLGASSLAASFTVTAVGSGTVALAGAQDLNAPTGSVAAANAAVAIADDIYDWINYKIIGDSSSPLPTISGSNTPETAVGYTDAVLRLIENKEFLVQESIEYVRKNNPGAFITYFNAANRAFCERDLREYIDAITHDLIYTGNYRSIVAAKYYEISVTGSTLSDMFYMRNGTGLRNCTLQGLSGTLGAANAYGTQRPTAGAYVSLDPGWGPAHEEVWITNKSPYVQNVSTFGTGCVGLKVDGALHNSGNDSVVANDFTQILSDGIGFWVTNLGRSELVSVFTYYNHIGYLAENGGKVRATNGNNSYGDFGSVSEGGDSAETPIEATVDNHSTDAVVANTFTDGDRILALEYGNAGVNYNTSATITISGDGYGLAGTTATVKNGSVYQIRLDETVVSPESDFGGDGYQSNTNVAQTGTDKTITISNTDTSLASQLPGMALWIKEGLGAGQYAYVVGYNAGTKLAKVAVPSFTNLTVTIATASSDLFTTSSTTSLQLNMPIMFSGTSFGGVVTTPTNVTIYYIKTIASATTFSISTSPGGSTFDITADDTGTMYLHKAGYDHLVKTTVTATTTGTNLLTCASTSALYAGLAVQFEGRTFGGLSPYTQYYVIASGLTATQFRVSTTSGGAAVALSTAGTGALTTETTFSVSGTSIVGAATYTAVSQSATSGTGTGAIFTIQKTGALTSYSSANTTVTVTTEGSGYVVGDTITIPGASLGGATPANNLTLTVASYVGSMIVQGTEALLDGTTTYEYVPRLVVSASPTGDTAVARAIVTTNKISSIRIINPGSGYVTAPTVTIVDPSNTVEAPLNVFIGNGVLAQPTFTNRGLAFVTAATTITDNGIQKTVSGVTNANPAVVTTSTAHTFTTGNKVQFDNVAGIFELNTGVWYYISVLSATTFSLYIDEALSIPVNSTTYGTYTASAGTVTTFGGYRDALQSGKYIQVEGLTEIPIAGSNVEFASVAGEYYKLVSVQNFLGSQYPFTALLQISPELRVSESPAHGDTVTIRRRYSQIRLTGHDFLDIGTGNFSETNYPGLPTQNPISANETVENGGGRVFFTSTDQDGNFRVGDLFSVEQSTGVATLNADAFNISGLQELQLGELVLGGTSASINEFSTDGTMAANSDQIVPTQRAIRTYIASQIGGGASSLNVNQITAGLITIYASTIETTTGVTINFGAPVNFTRGVTGGPLSMGYFLQG